MRACGTRFVWTIAAMAAAAISSAESYQAVIYGYPAGFSIFQVTGGGENGLVGGQAKNEWMGPSRAMYMTPQGTRNMHPAGSYSSSFINESWGATYHCGYAITNDEKNRAFFWLGGGAGVNIHPPGAEYYGSVASGGGGQLQVGHVEGAFDCTSCGHYITWMHAGMWSRTAASFTRLHAKNHSDTQAFATDGQRAVGLGINRTTMRGNALVWNGPNGFASNLHPSGYDESFALTIQGSKQGGWASDLLTGMPKAMLWTNTAASAVNLHPTPFSSSSVNFLRNGLQVGEGMIGSNMRVQAIAWHGSATTWINLHARLPAPFQTWNSTATGIDSKGNIQGYVYNADNTLSRAVIWKRI